MWRSADCDGNAFLLLTVAVTTEEKRNLIDEVQPMIVFWRGLGFVTALLAIAAAFVAVMVKAAVGLSAPEWALNGGVWVLAALFNALFAWKLGTPAARHLIDKNTGQEVIFTPRNDLFWVPVRYWTFIFLALAVVAAVANWNI